MWYYYQKIKIKRILMWYYYQKIKKSRNEMWKRWSERPTHPPGRWAPQDHGLAVTERERQAYERERESRDGDRDRGCCGAHGSTLFKRAPLGVLFRSFIHSLINGERGVPLHSYHPPPLPLSTSEVRRPLPSRRSRPEAAMVSPDTIRTAIGIIGASPVPVSTHGSGNHVVELMAAPLHGHVGCRLRLLLMPVPLLPLFASSHRTALFYTRRLHELLLPSDASVAHQICWDSPVPRCF
jgi:hypothetical protein